jgi:hypothetical protein
MDNLSIAKPDLPDLESPDDSKDDTSITDSTTSLVCPICTDSIIDDSHVLACGHYMHLTCFNLYTSYKIKQHETDILCPFCRTLLLSIHVEPPAESTQNVRSLHVTHVVRVSPVSPRAKLYRHIFWASVQMVLIAGVSFVVYTASNVKV